MPSVRVCIVAVISAEPPLAARTKETLMGHHLNTVEHIDQAMRDCRRCAESCHAMAA